MMMGFILALCCLFLDMAGTGNGYDLQGETCRIADGDVSMFDGREVSNGTLVISEGDYILRVKKEGGACLIIGDNTELVINGSLRLAPNSFNSYDIIRVVGSNVKIHGKGSIVGDRLAHTGSKGEWGMGINFRKASHATLSGLTIKECWGDCIYVGKNSSNIVIEDCLLDNSRRQGISVTSADGITIRNCNITNISGTNPQYAIDIEPNRQCVVDHVFITHVNVKNCEGGFRAALGKRTVGNARIGKVEIRNCCVTAKSRQTIHLAGCEQAVVNDCTIETRRGEKPILSRKVGQLSQKNNKVIYKNVR